MNVHFKWLAALALLLCAGIVQADPIKDGVLDVYKAGWYPNIYKNKQMTCPQTCRIRVGGVAEHEKSMGVKSRTTYVCKIGNGKKPLRDPRTLYGNQFDNTPTCFTTDKRGKRSRANQFHCLCITGVPCKGPDLVVNKIDRPTWDAPNHRSIIKAEIKNIGSAGAAVNYARIIDPSTNQPGGAPYNNVANTPALAAGATAIVTFYLPYWVYNPDADLEVTADYKGVVKECNEGNNSRAFHEAG